MVDKLSLDKNLAMRRRKFLELWDLAYNKYKTNTRRLAGEGWDADWKLLIVTMLSAQSRDEITIPVAEGLFEEYSSLSELANAPISDLINSLSRINYNKTKAKHIKQTAKFLLENHNGKVPRKISDLMALPGVGLKTANLVASELFSEDAICVDTHVHRIANVFELVNTTSPIQTEKELMKVAPKKYWRLINRIFVLLGQDVKGRSKDKFLEKLKEK